MKIGFIGAPGSGKTVLAAKLYAKLLENGVYSTRLVSEYAQDFLGSGGIITPETQIEITEKQKQLENATIKNNYLPIVCDSAIWLGAIYMRYNIVSHRIEPTNKILNYIDNTMDTFHDYEYLVYVPLFNEESKENEFRVHDFSDAEQIDRMIFETILDKSKLGQTFHAPDELHEREAFLDRICVGIRQNPSILSKLNQ